MNSKVTVAAIFLAGIGAGVGGTQLFTVEEAQALPAHIHTFCVRQDPPYGENDPAYDADAGVHYTVESYFNAAGPEGVRDLGARVVTMPAVIVEPFKTQILAAFGPEDAGTP